MTDDRSLERAARSWIEIGPTEAPPRVVEVALLRIDTTPQERALRIPWRLPTMNCFALLGATAATIAVVGLGGLLLVSQTPAPDPGVGVNPSASPFRSSGPMSTPAPTVPAPPMPQGDLAPGTYSIRPVTTTDTDLTLTLTVPAGWVGLPPAVLVGPHGSWAPNGTGFAFFDPTALYRDGCHWTDGDRDPAALVEVGPSMEDLAEALASHGAYQTTEPIEVRVSAHRALRLDVAVPTDIDLATCDRGEFQVFKAEGAHFYAQGPGQVFHLWIVDTSGTRFVIVNGDFAGTSAADRAQAQAIVDSIEIFQPELTGPP